MRDDLPVVGLSTSWNVERHGGLDGAVAELLEMGIGLIEAAAPDGAADVAKAATRLLEGRGRCCSVAYPLLPRDAAASKAPPALHDPDGERRARAVAAARATIAVAARLRAPCVVIAAEPVMAADREIRLAELRRAASGGDAAGRERILGEMLEARERLRTGALDRLCRALHGLHRAEPGVRLALAPSDDPWAVPDASELEWVFDELKGPAFRYWHDTGVAGVREALGLEPAHRWTDAYGDRLEGAYVSDFTAVTHGLPPGAGVADWADVRLQLSPRLPKMLKLMASSSRLAVREGIKTLG